MFEAAAHDVLKSLVPTVSDIVAREQIMGLNSPTYTDLCNESMLVEATAYIHVMNKQSNLFERIAEYVETMQAAESMQLILFMLRQIDYYGADTMFQCLLERYIA